MKLSKVYAALMLAGIVAGVSTQTNATQPTLIVDQRGLQTEQGRIQLAQAGGNPNNQGTDQGGAGGPGKAPGSQGGEGARREQQP